MTTALSVACIVLLLGIAYAASAHRSAVNWRTVGGALGLQVAIAGIVLYVPAGRAGLEWLSSRVSGVLGYAQSGIDFLFGDIGRFEIGFVFAFHVLPVIIFFSSLVAVLYYIGIMGWLIRVIGGALRWLLGTGRAESLSATANIFVSQTEAPLVIKPYLPSMTRSELFAVMVGGMATVAGSVLAGYVALGVEMKYLLAASFMAAPGGLLMAKLLLPETESLQVSDAATGIADEPHVNVFDAAAAGAANGLALAVNIGAMLLAFIGLIALLNGILGWMGDAVGVEALSLELLLGTLFRPLAFMLGVPWGEASVAGNLIGQKLVLNEFVAFTTFYEDRSQLSQHSQAVVSFALCGFANFSSIAILLGGLGTLAPSRRSDVAELGLRAVFAGFMANLMSAAIAGLFLSLA
ncbi:NupC/NupG family nucleoside CNT transporter [Chromatocurvus halotolerans]|uniref:Nucleoside permease n=1 Tax=Chromatocurvus halotolerans TaxID=1132028 RepID=A0A4R2KWZ1_9GAMM|nr:NupC/NupG family nucleoside CNT transporter [Chromatocurvus halotolerans]TCO78423.1 CNT family concentrative nucleoside transporter [Chromatocurvus halotolerans]